MGNIINKLQRMAWARKLIKFFRLHLLGNWWLHHFPIVRKLPGGDIRYRIRWLDSLAVAAQMFQGNKLYPATDIPNRINTFADLGCNVGYFTCWLLSETRNNRLKGIMVDANEEILEEARWHAQTNGLQGVETLYGLVGTGDREGEADFFVHLSTECSGAYPPPGSEVGSSCLLKKVPCINIEINWKKLMGDVPCDLLKVDIEGAEMDFFKTETDFLRRVQTIFVEWHEWKVNLEQINSFLKEHDFSLRKVLDQNPAERVGTAIFSKNPSNN
jgi:FkbM family methyltransferase